MRYRIYGVFLLALGLLTLILGLMPPRTTDVIIVGGAVIIAGLLEFTLARGRTPPRIPASCKKEAQKALELRRTIDWEKLKTTIRFEDAGISPRTILIFVPQGKIQKRGTDMDQNVNYYGIILLLRQLRESGSFSEKELRRVAARIAADSGADIMISL